MLARLPADCPGVLITQHIPQAFSQQFAARMDACSALSVQEASDGILIQSGRAYIAPGNRHLLVERDGAHYRCRLHDGAPVNRHRPSVDLLFGSMARHLGAHGVGVILTGMGADGARGLRQMRDSGAYTIAQDEASSVVWGMPGAAVALGAVERVMAIEQIAAALHSQRPPRGRARGCRRMNHLLVLLQVFAPAADTLEVRLLRATQAIRAADVTQFAAPSLRVRRESPA